MAASAQSDLTPGARLGRRQSVRSNGPTLSSAVKDKSTLSSHCVQGKFLSRRNQRAPRGVGTAIRLSGRTARGGLRWVIWAVTSR